MANEKITAKIKEELFEDFFHVAWNSFQALEHQFNIQGVMDQVFGKDATDANVDEAKQNLRNSDAWITLTRVFDYAVNGVEPDDDQTAYHVIDGADVLKLVTSENYSPCETWDNVIAMGDGRFALDEGSAISLYKVALLANVDIRTVRNAISSGELISFKPSDGGETTIENSSARRWLHGRRGFKHTVSQFSKELLRLESISTPADFGDFLTHRRTELGLDSKGGKLMVFHPNATAQAISQLESGIFELPLDAAFPIADFYLLDRKAFLQCVMRVFFFEEMQMLSDVAE